MCHKRLDKSELQAILWRLWKLKVENTGGGRARTREGREI